jgi:hypothetical protein
MEYDTQVIIEPPEQSQPVIQYLNIPFQCIWLMEKQYFIHVYVQWIQYTSQMIPRPPLSHQNAHIKLTCISIFSPTLSGYQVHRDAWGGDTQTSVQEDSTPPFPYNSVLNAGYHNSTQLSVTTLIHVCIPAKYQEVISRYKQWVNMGTCDSSVTPNRCK